MAKSVDLKISASKKSIKRAIKKERVKNVAQDAEISKLKAALKKLKKKRPSARVSEYNLFVRKQIKAGLSFVRAAREWSRYKSLEKKRGRRISAYNQFIGSQMRLGRTFKQSVALWKLAKAGKLGKRGRVRTITRTIVKKVPSVRVVRDGGKSEKIVPSEPDASRVRQLFLEGASSFSRTSDSSSQGVFDEDELALKLLETYFAEVARYGFKRRLSLEEIIDAYFYSVARVRSGKKISAGDFDREIRVLTQKS